MKFAKHYLFLSAAILIHAAPASAITIDGGAAWPGSANTTGVSGSGSVMNGGDSWTYPNIGNSAVENLYFGLSNLTGQGVSADGAGISGAEVFTWFADTSNSIEYHSTMFVPGSGNYLTRYLLTAVAGATVVSDATTQALAGSVHSLFNITGSSFTVSRELEIWNGSSWQNFNPFYDNIQGKTYSGTTLNVSTGFYWQNEVQQASVPEPATLSLMGLGLLGLVLGRRRHA